MTEENTLSTLNSAHSCLKRIKKMVYDIAGLHLTNLQLNTESKEYGACSFKLNGKKIHFRVSKITPTKVGQFVAIWKRGKDGVTEPFDVADDFDFIIIASKNEENFGQFIFSKSVLVNYGVITNDGKSGKRGMRVYPPWVVTTNKQAKKTQSWQTNYFLTIEDNSITDFDRMKKWFKETKS